MRALKLICVFLGIIAISFVGLCFVISPSSAPRPSQQNRLPTMQLDPFQGSNARQAEPAVIPTVKMPGWTSLTIPAGKTEFDMDAFYNPADNEGMFYLTFTILIDDGSGELEEVYRSGLCEPGKRISRLQMERALEVGEYKAVVHIQPFSMDDLEALNSADVNLTLTAQ